MSLLALLAGHTGSGSVPVAPQAPGPSPEASAAAARAADRIRALQREADALAGQEKGVLTELRGLEIDRDLKLEQARRLDAEAAEAARRVDDTTTRIRSAEAAIEAARPALEARLVDLYKLGRPSYARLILDLDDLRDVARASRLVAAVAQSDQRRVAEYTRDISRLGTERAALERQSAELARLQVDARAASEQATRAAETRAEFVRRIDARRDLNAQLVSELEAARDRLTKAFSAFASPAAADPALLPIRPFRGALAWPAKGRLVSRFGQYRNPRFGTTTRQNGVEIAAAEDAPVRSVHEGRVVFADVFTGFGQLVIVDHGSLAYSLYGYLGSMSVIKGARVAGDQPIGTVGRSPAGQAALYFELRIDGRPVNPLEWLEAK